jgi:hypothetical protein
MHTTKLGEPLSGTLNLATLGDKDFRTPRFAGTAGAASQAIADSVRAVAGARY